MNRILGLFICLFVWGIPSGKAQTFTVNGGSTGNHLYNLLYTWYLAPRSQRLATHLPASQLTAGGMAPDALINSIELERLSGDNQSFPVGGANVKIYLQNRPASSADLGAGTLTWNTEIAGATLVFDGDPSGPLGSSPGWKLFSFGTGSGAAATFSYTGGALVVFAEYVHTVSTGASPAIPLMYATAAEGLPVPNGWTTNSTKYTNNSTTTPSATMATSTANHPHMRFTFASDPCTAPPDAGTAMAAPNSNVCPGSPVALTRSGGTTGTGQTYQWFSSSSMNGTYVAVNSVSQSSGLIVNPTANTWYRLEITCGGMTSTTAPVMVGVDPGLPAGTYTINNGLPTSGTNFTSFADALSAMTCGIQGPVVFEVDPASGPYSEQITIPQVPNSSATNTIIFRGNGRTIQATPVSATRAIVKLDGADYVTLDSLNLITLDATYGWGVHLTNDAQYNTITRCTIDIRSTSATEANSGGIVASASATSVLSTGNNATYCTITGNRIMGGYQGIIMHGSSSARALGNMVSNNTITDFYANGLQFSYQNGTVISANDISRAGRASVTTMAGIEMGTGNWNTVINGNRIHDTHNTATTQSGAAYGIYFNACDASKGNENKVTNNLIYNFNSVTGTQYGLYNSSSDSVWYYHNTIVLDDPASTSGTTRGIYQITAATGVEFKNNLVYISRAGTGTKYLLYFSTSTSSIVSDFNGLYMGSAAGTNYTGYWSAVSYATLADWQAVGLYDASSTDVQPIFNLPGSGDYSPVNAAFNNLGTYAGVNADINGAARSNSTPDLGAYEFDVAGCSTPPTPGKVTINPGSVCPGTPLDLNVAGNSFGIGQTYTWESSATLAGPYASISTAQTQTDFNYAINASAYIRLAVTCSGVTSYSDTIYVNVPSLFPAGTYTINSGAATGAGNFQSFSDAVSAIRCGIAGAITFNVVPGSGPYTEQVSIPAIQGTSAANQVIFNGNGATIQFTPTTSARYVIELDGADYVTLDSVNITVETGSAYGWGIHLTNDARYNTISRCLIDVTAVSSTTQANSAGIVASGTATSVLTTGNNASFTNITSNTVLGAYQGIIMYGITSSKNEGNSITNNKVRDFYGGGIEVAYQDGALIQGNDISRATRVAVTTFRGIEVTTGCQRTTVNANRIHDTHNAASSQSGTAYGVYLNAADAPAGFENKVTNNLIYNFNSGTGTQYGLANSSSDSVGFYHNTVVLDNAASTSGAAYGFYQTTTARGIAVKNNLFYVTRGGTGSKYGLYFGATGTASTIVSDRNDLYVASPAGTNNTGYLALPTPATSYTTLADWQAASGQDANSVSMDPLFVDPPSGNYLPNQMLLDNLGEYVGVDQDIVNIARSGTTPDIGAYEFIGTALPVKLISISAAGIKQDVVVKWSVSSEVNASHYEIERSADGINFVYAGKVAARNLSSVSDYEYADPGIFHITPINGSVFYRLKMVDIDSRFEYSPIVKVVPSPVEKTFVKAYENPIQKNPGLIVGVAKATVAQVMLIGASGEKLYTGVVKLNAGTTLVTIPGGAQLAQGIYIATVILEGKRYSVKLVK